MRDIPQESDLWLIFAPIKSYRMNITIQKATELGISRFIPILTEYTNQSKINFKNFELNMIEASEQTDNLSDCSDASIIFNSKFLKFIFD